MRLLEHQSKKLLSNFGLVFTESTPIDSMGEVRGTIERVGLPAVLKAQTPFGGRGPCRGGEVCRRALIKPSLRQRRCSEWTCAAQRLKLFRLNRN